MVPRRPPLGPPGRELWDELTAAYTFTPGEIAILRQLCQVADVIHVLHESWAAQDDVTVIGSRGQPRVSPILTQLTEQRRLFDQLVRSLGLPDPEEQTGPVLYPVEFEPQQKRLRRGGPLRGSSAGA